MFLSESLMGRRGADRSKAWLARVAVCWWPVWLAACGPQQPVEVVSPPGPVPFYETRFERHPDPAELTELGRSLFSDPSLSASGQQSCATCHSPQHAYAPPNALSVQMGGARLNLPGQRAAPSLMYQQATPAFSEHFSDNDGNDSIDQGPTGGRTWDGRVSSAHEQAALPLLSPLEMGNVDSASVIEHLRHSAQAEHFKATFGPAVFDDVPKAWNGLLWALEVFQQSPQDFYPFTSKYDAFLRGQTTLSPTETRGLAIFNDPTRGNCMQCHPGAVKRGAFPVFTDYGHLALGAPRNFKVAANADAAWFDLGLCGPLRTDLKDHPEYCGLFKTPSLRNVAQRKSYFHNGVFHRLEDVVSFYAYRDTQPEKFYPRDPQGRVQLFNDLPQAYHRNVNRDVPFGGAPGDKPRLTEADVADLVAYLKTLSDGYHPLPQRR
jgi:cytochrome c peroxidase